MSGKMFSLIKKDIKGVIKKRKNQKMYSNESSLFIKKNSDNTIKQNARFKDSEAIYMMRFWELTKSKLESKIMKSIYKFFLA